MAIDIVKMLMAVENEKHNLIEIFLFSISKRCGLQGLDDLFATDS